MKKIIFVIPLIFMGSLAYSQEKIDGDFYELSLEELMNTTVSVASKTELTQRESPGIVSVITDAEIRNMGARDLMDVLNMIPGLSFAGDVQGTVGLGIRGNWAFEGKVLVLLDGQEMNETQYATVTFGNHFNVNNISKIEIIRGPGSSIYGGFAELGVINIITKKGEQIGGIRADVNYGALDGATARTNASVSIGDKVGDVEYSINGFFGQGLRSEKDYVDFSGNRTSLTNNELNPMQINMGLKLKGLSTRFIYDNFQTTSFDWFGDVEPEAYQMDFKALYGEVKYDLQVNDKLSITPKVNIKNQKPWYSENGNPAYKITANRVQANLSVNYSPNEVLNIVGGFDSYFDNSKNDDPIASPYFSNGTDEVSYNNLAGFVQARLVTDVANFTVGARYDQHNEFGGAFSPRVGLTKVFDKLHFKLLYSQSFRAPAVENINLKAGAEIKPEKTGVLEFETGYKLTDQMAISANIYDMTIKDPIVYYYDVVLDAEVYGNFSKSGSRGVDLEYRYKSTWGYITANYSLYTANNKNEVVLYEVPADKNAVLGLSNHRLNIFSSIKLGDVFSINPSANWLGKRYAVQSLDINDEGVIGEVDPSLYINLYLRANNLFTKGLEAGVGVYDLLNTGTQYIQPYNSGHSALNGTGREITIRLGYKFQW